VPGRYATEEQRNEQLTAVLRKVETEGEFLQKNIGVCREKKEKLMDTHQKLKKSLEQTEEHADQATKAGGIFRTSTRPKLNFRQSNSLYLDEDLRLQSATHADWIRASPQH
jgi:hypothetical protein